MVAVPSVPKIQLAFWLPIAELPVFSFAWIESVRVALEAHPDR